jgi:hypothetical protein
MHRFLEKPGKKRQKFFRFGRTLGRFGFGQPDEMSFGIDKTVN